MKTFLAKILLDGVHIGDASVDGSNEDIIKREIVNLIPLDLIADGRMLTLEISVKK